ncbi:3-hydroxyacyl-CoA dehydrogenase NAD-binding domain-containing protein, partial [Candidatus Pseudoscillospira sp. SGI.172]|uniref:3-hydroxyacyl-CoA dehydrogenase NAD-binding domain-containing protein n=1 Tax=Candidatus Pseudoscillospira sp. SGI.172 TaxID=3420582 RepID=UPI003D0130FF
MSTEFYNKNWEVLHMSINKVVVIGGGTMGLDIAQVFARSGKQVTVRDINDQLIQAAEAR